jgi:hypothetical protein
LRNIVVCLAAGLTLAVAGCTSTAPEGGVSSPAPRSGAGAFSLADGTYNAVFPGNYPGFGSLCGKMVISGGGKSINYSSGGCARAPGFRSGGSFDGSTIRIRQATYALTNVTSSSMTGRWTLGSYSADVTFRK